VEPPLQFIQQLMRRRRRDHAQGVDQMGVGQFDRRVIGQGQSIRHRSLLLQQI
jgi:hypothetical protein